MCIRDRCRVICTCDPHPEAFADRQAILDFEGRGVREMCIRDSSYGTLYDWDQYFEAILQFYCGYPTTYAINAIRLFLKQQHEDGHIVRTVPEFAWSKREHVKPFLCQIAFLCYLVDGHLDWLNTEVFEGLARYIEHWTVHLAPREGGLPVWDCASHSGMDRCV